MVRKPDAPQWSFQVDKELDKATKEAALEVDMPLSAFVRAVVRGYLRRDHGLVRDEYGPTPLEQAKKFAQMSRREIVKLVREEMLVAETDADPEPEK